MGIQALRRCGSGVRGRERDRVQVQGPGREWGMSRRMWRNRYLVSPV
jgi:hypothetical protein